MIQEVTEYVTQVQVTLFLLESQEATDEAVRSWGKALSRVPELFPAVRHNPMTAQSVGKCAVAWRDSFQGEAEGKRERDSLNIVNKM